VTTHEWQWIIWGVGIIFGVLPIVSMYNKIAGLVVGNLLMWPVIFFSLSPLTERLKEMGIGM